MRSFCFVLFCFCGGFYFKQFFPHITTVETDFTYPQSRLKLYLLSHELAALHTNVKHNGAQSARAESTHKDVPLVEFMYLVFTRIAGENYRRRFRSLLLYLCYVFGALINCLVC